MPPKPGVRRILVLENASWHKVKTLQWQHFEPLFLPPYSPDLNPIERLWLRLKADYFTDWIARTGEDLMERLCKALNHFIDHPFQNRLHLLIPAMSFAFRYNQATTILHHSQEV